MLFGGKWRQKVFIFNCRVFLQLPAGIPIKGLSEKSVEDAWLLFLSFSSSGTQAILCCHHQKLKHSGSRIGQNILDTYAGKQLLPL